MLKQIELQIHHWLNKNRGLLSVDEIKILEDCLELSKIAEQTEDKELRKIHLLDLTVKISAFLLKDKTKIPKIEK